MRARRVLARLPEAFFTPPVPERGSRVSFVLKSLTLLWQNNKGLIVLHAIHTVADTANVVSHYFPQLSGILITSPPPLPFFLSCVCPVLCSSERMLHHYYGLDKPPWFTDDVYEGFDSNGCECFPLDIGRLIGGGCRHVNMSTGFQHRTKGTHNMQGRTHEHIHVPGARIQGG